MVTVIVKLFCFYSPGDGEKLPEIATEDLGKIEDLLDHVASTKQDLMKEVEELKALKEDITEYREVMNSAGLLGHAECGFMCCLDLLQTEIVCY
jgi:myo-inositol catabolism protein IolC